MSEQKIKHQTQDRYAIIGAGPSGLAAAKALKEAGIAFDGFEMGIDVGGLWNIDNPRSTVYASAHLISSKTTTQFLDFPMPDTAADYPNHAELLQYFKSYCDKFGLREHYFFNTAVAKAERDEASGLWQLTLDDGHTYTYQGILVANGTLSEPNIPTFKGQENFTGEIIHSHQYKYADVFKHKRVLVVGAGNSGCDIAVDAVHYADKVDMSVRRGYYFIPKYVFGKPSDTLGGMKLPRRMKQWLDKKVLGWFTGDPTRFGFPKPDYNIYESHPIINTLILTHLGQGDIKIKGDISHLEGKTVHFKNGESSEYDLILLATGYKLHYPFLDKKYLNWSGYAPELYLNIFHPKYDNLFVLGMIEAAGIGWEGRAEQSRLVAAYINGLAAKKPSALAFRSRKEGKNPDMSGGYKYLALERMSYYVHKETYRNLIRKNAAALLK
jgi:hypothetical protein